MRENRSTVEYAIRYCMSRRSYAYADGMDLAEYHWAHLSKATRDDVLTATRVHGFPSDDNERWPTIWAARFKETA